MALKCICHEKHTAVRSQLMKLEEAKRRNLSQDTKMQPLVTTRRMMTWLSMHPPDESANAYQKRGYIMHTRAILILLLISVVASLSYCLKFFYTDFEGATFAFMTSIACTGLIYMFFAAILLRYQIAGIFTSLSNIYKSSEFLDLLFRTLI